MGAQFWSYFVPYQEDIGAALEGLREREFEAGRYYVPPGSKPPTSIGGALKTAAETGTRSILDMVHVSKRPDYYSVASLPPHELVRLFGTEQPTRQMIEASHEFGEDIERGQGVYVIAYKDGTPDEIYFAGYSFD